MGNRPRADIFFGMFLGNGGTWHKDPDFGSLPDIVDSTETFNTAVAALAGLIPPPEPYEANKAAHQAYWLEQANPEGPRWLIVTSWG